MMWRAVFNTLKLVIPGLHTAPQAMQCKAGVDSVCMESNMSVFLVLGDSLASPQFRVLSMGIGHNASGYNWIDLQPISW